MNINLVIDQLVVEGMTLSRGERAVLEASLRESLMQTLSEKAVAHVLPEGRRTRRELMQVSLSGNMDGTRLGNSLGTMLGSHVWDGQVSPLNGQGERR
jgi:hypothetical protein